MLFHSGIGSVIRNVLGQWHEDESGPKPDLLVPGATGVDWAATALPDFPSRRVDVPIYSLREQFLMPRLTQRSEVLWVPHFNVPLAADSTVVVTIHDLLHLAHPEFFPGLRKKVYARGMLAGAVRKARRIIAVSDFTASELVRYTKADPNRITVVHNGVASRWFEPSPSPSPRPRPYFLFVGNIKPHKNLKGLIPAFSAVAEALPDHDLVIVGKKDGFITADHQAEKAAATAGNRIVFTGFLDDISLKQYVTHAEALVYPSLYEGFGLPPLEAMAAGCPVIAADIPALRESCGGAAIYCDPLCSENIGDAMRSAAMLAGAERAGLVTAGKLHAKRFTWRETARQTLAVLEEAAS